MLPNLPVGQGAPSMGGSSMGAPTGGAPEQGAPPEDMRRMLVTVLQKVQQVAEQSGLDFGELLAEASGGGSGMAPAPMGAPAPAPMPMG